MSPEDQDKVLEYLNSIFLADPQAVHALMANRVPCTNNALYDHPHIVVGRNNVIPGYNIGALGMLNGLLTTLGLERVAMKFDDSDIPNGFGKFVGFVKYEDKS